MEDTNLVEIGLVVIEIWVKNGNLAVPVNNTHLCMWIEDPDREKIDVLEAHLAGDKVRRQLRCLLVYSAPWSDGITYANWKHLDPVGELLTKRIWKTGGWSVCRIQPIRSKTTRRIASWALKKWLTWCRRCFSCTRVVLITSFCSDRAYKMLEEGNKRSE